MHIFHRYKIIKYQIIPHLSFMDAISLRVIRKCKVCGKIGKIPLNMAMPLRYNNDEYDDMWEDC